jgi:hypothetical protein
MLINPSLVPGPVATQKYVSPKAEFMNVKIVELSGHYIGVQRLHYKPLLLGGGG